MPLKKKAPDDLFSTAEIKTALNNAVIAALRPATLGAELPRKRMLRLSSYVQAFTHEIFGHIEEGYLRPEEAVLLFTTAALFVQSRIHETPAEPEQSVSVVAASVLASFFDTKNPVAVGKEPKEKHGKA